jgi:uncharacterized protein YsxB (DUF464 family)
LIEIKIVRDSKSRIKGYSISGHAGYRRKGKDIVCAAVSALAQGALMGLTEYAGIDPEYKVDEDKGILECRVNLEKLNAQEMLQVQAILECMTLSLKSVQLEYSDYVAVKEVTQC